MKIPDFLAAAAVSVILAMQAWALVEIVNLKVDVAGMKSTIQAMSRQTRDSNYQTENLK
jgi:hypothetical protein